MTGGPLTNDLVKSYGNRNFDNIAYSNVVMITWLIWIALRCPRKVSRFNNSLTHTLLFTECHFYLRSPLVPMGIVVISCIPNVPNGITALTL